MVSHSWACRLAMCGARRASVALAGYVRSSLGAESGLFGARTLNFDVRGDIKARILHDSQRPAAQWRSPTQSMLYIRFTGDLGAIGWRGPACILTLERAVRSADAAARPRLSVGLRQPAVFESVDKRCLEHSSARKASGRASRRVQWVADGCPGGPRPRLSPGWANSGCP